mgnify:CR=1 FL=1
MRLFEVQGKKSVKLQAIQFQNLPIASADFVGAKSDEILMCGPRRFMFSLNMKKSSTDYIQLICLYSL